MNERSREGRLTIERGSERSSKLGLLWMLLGTGCFVGMAAFVKALREDGLTTSEVMFWRTAPGLVWILVELRVRGQALRPNAPGPVILRSLAGLGAMAGYFYALRALTLIENTVLSLLQPVLVAVLSPTILGERLDPRALVALIVAVLGALVVLRPDEAWRANLPLLPIAAGAISALLSALAHIMVRKATAKDSPELVVLWFTVTVSVGALMIGLARGEFLELPPGVIWKIAGMAGFGLAGQLLMTRAYGRMAAPMVAVVAYAAIPLSMLVDLAWGVRPGINDALGSLLMVIAGVALVRSRRV
ncbi:EamA-like transporter family protein [Enhygromyxa salina]|uniref:EamA-like transporter family protein n=1 Tax=Enhygromyxa salina TaxID=215803 RepID=A0A2S9Y8C1_9BACT|nr:EamA-like transporter family protein [Enhygromyxa salina]